MSDQFTTGPESEEWRGMTPHDRGLSAPMVDDVFDLLADWRRRAVCRHFATNEASAASLETLTTVVARRGAARDVADAETAEAFVGTELVEVHLPRLDEAGVVDFDERSGSVRYWGHPTVEKWAEHAAAVSER